MSTRANKLTEQQIKDKAVKERLQKNARSRKYRAAKKAAKGGATSVVTKKTPICAQFPPDLVALKNEAKRLEINGQKEKITGEMKKAVSVINRMYTAKKKESVVKVIATTLSAEGKQKKRSKVVKAVPACACLPSDILSLNRAAAKLRYCGESKNLTPEMRKAERFIANFYANKKKYGTSEPCVVVKAAPALIEAPKRTALDELADQYADVADEVFNFNWCPASRRSNLTVNITVSF